MCCSATEQTAGQVSECGRLLAVSEPGIAACQVHLHVPRYTKPSLGPCAYARSPTSTVTTFCMLPGTVRYDLDEPLQQLLLQLHRHLVTLAFQCC